MEIFDHEGSKDWIYVLDSFVQNMNESENRTIGMAPNDVTEDNSSTVFVRLYGHPHQMSKPNFLLVTLLLLASTPALL